jgi:4,5-dihydroxyphthalate decarboxylase
MFNPVLGPMVNRRAGIRRPQDLEGKRVGVSGFAFNPAVWLRGILLHHHDVAPERITWVEGEPNSQSGVPYFRSHRFAIEKTEQNLLKLAEEGKIDAFFMADGGVAPTANLDRLFPDFFAEVRRYHQATGVFPVNSLLTIKEATARAHPDLARALVEAFQEAGRLYHGEEQDGAFHMGLPVGELRKAGLFPHRDGLAANRKALRQMVHYCYEQSVIHTLFEPEELFIQL